MIASMQERLSLIRKNLYGSQSEYEEVILKPILDSQSVK
jgi:hypothetical protein